MRPKTIVGIDPGSMKSNFVLLLEDHVTYVGHQIDNDGFVREVLTRLDWGVDAIVVIEEIESYGVKHIGVSTFRTCFWIGRFVEAFTSLGVIVALMPRRYAKKSLALAPNARDRDVRQSLMERFAASGQTGTGDVSPIGTLRHPGPLYGMKGHCWDALAVAWAIQEGVEPLEKIEPCKDRTNHHNHRV